MTAAARGGRRPRVALATAGAIRDLEEDDRALLPALAQHGIAAEAAVWDDATVDWRRYDLVLVRSTWDYPPRRAAFLRWAERVGSLTRLENPAPVLRWNTDKRYLRELRNAGAPVVDTVWFDPGDEPNLPAWDELVVKPAVSAGAKDTARYPWAEREAAGEHVAALLAAHRTVMVQPYLGAVDEQGESALVYLGGELSHAVRKGPLLQPGAGLVEGLYAPEDITGRPPTGAECAVAEAVLAAQPFAGLLYARVDLVAGPDGTPLLLELELTEPSLFLAHAAGSVERLAAAVAARLPRAGLQTTSRNAV